MAKSDQGNLVDAADVAALEKELAKLQAQLKQVYDGFGKLGSLGKAMEAPASSVKTLNAELEETDKLLKLNPSSLTLLRQKQVLLKDSIAETKDKLAQLKAEQKDFAKSDKSMNNAQYRELRREIVATKQSLSSLKDEKKSFSVIGSSARAVKDTFVGMYTSVKPLANGIRSVSDAAKKGMKETIEFGKSSLQALDPEGFQAKSDAITAQIDAMKGAIGMGFVPVVSEALNTFSAGVPKITESFSAIFSGQAEGDAGLASNITNMVTGMINNVAENLPNLLTQLNTVVGSLLTSFGVLLPTLMETIIPALIQGLVGLINTIITQIPVLLPIIMQAAFDLFFGFVSGLTQVIPVLMEQMPVIIQGIITKLIENLPLIILSGIQLLNSLIAGIVQAIPQLVNMLPGIITTLVSTLMQHLPELISAGVQLIVAVATGLPMAIPDLLRAIPQILSALVNEFKKQDWGTIGKDILGGIIDGLKNALSGIGNKIKEIKDKLLDKFQFYFKIDSPSKVFRDEVGKYLAAGIGVGFEQEMKRVTKQMQRAVPVSFAAKARISAQGQYGGASAANALYGQQSVNQTVNIYSPGPLSPAETARQTRNATRQMLLAMKVG